MRSPQTTVVMRSRNEGARVYETLDALRRQTLPYRLVVLDNNSTDGTAAALADAADVMIAIPAGAYVPGRVLNLGAGLAETESIVFLNADCTPEGPDVLEKLHAAVLDADVGAAFGRQVPRTGCHPLQARDTEDAFGDGSGQARFDHFFSMAVSAVRTSTWRKIPFDEALSYSEDIDWSWKVRRSGLEVLYVPGAVARHSHDYTLAQWYRRHRGEGRAEAQIFDWTRWRRSLLRYSALPFLAQVLRDWRYVIPRGHLGSVCYAPIYRLSQALGRRRGFIEGLKAGGG